MRGKLSNKPYAMVDLIFEHVEDYNIICDIELTNDLIVEELVDKQHTEDRDKVEWTHY